MQKERVVNNIYAVLKYMYRDINISKDTIKAIINKTDNVSIRKEVKDTIIRMSSAYNYVYMYNRRSVDLQFVMELYDILTGKDVPLKEDAMTANNNIQELYEEYSSTDCVIDLFTLYFIREFVYNGYYRVFLLMLEKFLLSKNRYLNIVDWESFNKAVSEVASGYWDTESLNVIKSAISGG